jgi:hypothetical protein
LDYDQLKSEDRGKRERRFSLVSAKERGRRATVSRGRKRPRKETAGGRRKKIRLV